MLRHSEATWHWSFPGATYVSSTTVPNPKVVYANPGTYDITLTVTQGSDSSTKTIPAMITVPADQCGFDPLPGLAADLSKDSTDFITIPPLPLKTNHFTAMCWVKPQGIQHDWAAIFQNDNATGFGFTAGTNEMEYHWNGQQWWWNSGLIIAPDVWSHVAIVVTPDSTTLYVNGVGVTNPVPNDTFDFSAAISRLGQDRGYGSVRNFNGLIDEFAVYDRSLTREEVRKTMHITHSSSERGLFLYYQFDEPAFSETFDRIGVNHGDGTNRTISTAPFASGTSVLDTIEGPGVYQFGLAGVELRSSRSDTSPEREICAYRLQGPPDSLPSMNGKYTDHYWIIRSWGGATSGAVDTLAFLNIGAISASDSAALADHFVLLGREANAEQNDWSPFVNKPIQAFSGIANSLWYSFPDSTISDYQFEIANTGTSTLGVPPAVLPVYSNTLRISPNPATDRVIVFYDTRSSDIATQLVVTDLLGRVLEERVLLDHVSGAQTTTVDLSRYPDGSYLIRVGDKTAIIVKD